MKNIMLLHRQSFKNQMSDQEATDIKNICLHKFVRSRQRQMYVHPFGIIHYITLRCV